MAGDAIEDEALSAFVAGTVPTTQAVGDRLAIGAYVVPGGAVDRMLDWTRDRGTRAYDVIAARADYADRVELYDVRDLADMAETDADTVMLWAFSAGARAGAEEIVRQARALGIQAGFVLPDDWPEPPVDVYRRPDDPRRLTSGECE